MHLLFGWSSSKAKICGEKETKSLSILIWEGKKAFSAFSNKCESLKASHLLPTRLASEESRSFAKIFPLCWLATVAL